jgi:MFS family permease
VTGKRRRRPKLDPFELILCAVFGLSGIMQLVFGPSAGSAASTMPSHWRMLWVGLMTIGCAVTLLGALVPWVWGYLVEQVGLAATGWSLIAYGCQILFLQIQSGTLTPFTVAGGPLVVALGLGFLWKRQQIISDLKRLNEVIVP